MADLTPTESKALLEDLKRIEAEKQEVLGAVERNRVDNKIYYFTRHNPPQRALLTGWRNPLYKVFTYTGANRIGKTTMGACLSYSTMFGEYPWTCKEGEPGTGVRLDFPHRKPRKIRIIGQAWEKHIKAVLIDRLLEFCPQKRRIETRKNGQGVDALWVDTITGSSIEIMSNLQDSKLHEGWDGDLVIYDEPPLRKIRVANARGLVDRQGRELFTMTLLNEPWVSREVIQATLEDGTPDPTIFNVHGEIYDNVGYGITEEGVVQFAKTLTAAEKEARLLGIPSYMSGLVLNKFKRERNVINDFKVPLDWMVDIHIDFHPAKPWAVLFVATDPKGFKFGVNEIFENGSWKHIGEQIIRAISFNNYRVNEVLLDPLSKGDKQGDLNEESVYDKLQTFFMAYDINIKTASKDKTSGISMTNDLLLTENKMAGLFFFRSLRRTIYEIEGWMYDDDGKAKKVDDDMVEGLYRIILADTQWYDKDDEYYEDEIDQTGRNGITGY